MGLLDIFKNPTAKLLSAVYRNNIDDVIKLIKKGVDLNAKDDRGDCALVCAARLGQMEIIKLLLEHGVNVNVENNEGETALLWACSRGDTEIVKNLLKKGVDINIKRKSDKWTALICAAYDGRTEIVTLLIDNGANIKDRDISGKDALDWATFQGKREIVNALTRKG